MGRYRIPREGSPSPCLYIFHRNNARLDLGREILIAVMGVTGSGKSYFCRTNEAGDGVEKVSWEVTEETL